MNEAATAGRLRFDGLYYRASGHVTSFLRFFADGTVVGTSIATTRTGHHAGAFRRWWHGEKSPASGAMGAREMAARTISWLNAGWSQKRGTYTVEGSEVEFFLVSGPSRVEYRGTIAADALVLDSHGHALGREVMNARYDFAPVTA